MDKQAIFDSLANLEKGLLEINSAAEMVKNTTSSYEAVQKEIQNYTNSLANISNLIKNIVTEIKTYNSETNHHLNALVDQKFNELHNAVNKLNLFNNEIKNNINEDLKNFITVNKDILQRISEALNLISKQFLNSTNLTLDKLSNNADHFINNLKLHSSSIDQQVANLASEINNLKTVYATFEQKLEENVKSINTTISENYKKLNRNILFNNFFTLSIFVAFGVLLYFLFVNNFIKF